MGHEFSAVVKEVHPSVTSLVPGSRVVVEPVKADKTCHMCLKGRSECCENAQFHGYHIDGGLAQLVKVDASFCFLLPDSISLELGALVEPIAVAWHAVKYSGFTKGKTALVVGTGPIGIATVVCLKAVGIPNERIMVIGRSEAKNDRVRQLGVEQIYHSSNENLVEIARSLFGG